MFNFFIINFNLELKNTFKNLLNQFEIEYKLTEYNYLNDKLEDFLEADIIFLNLDNNIDQNIISLLNNNILFNIPIVILSNNLSNIPILKNYFIINKLNSNSIIKSLLFNIKNLKSFNLKSLTLLNYFKILICILDLNGRILYVNNELCDFFSKNKDDFLNKDFKVIFPNEYNEKLFNFLNSVLSSNQIQTIECDFKLNQIEKKWIEWTFVPIKSFTNEITNFLLYGINITKSKSIEENLQIMNENLEVIVRDKTFELLYINSKLESEINQRKIIEETLANEKEQLAVILKSIGDGIIVINENNIITLINNTAESLLNIKNEEYIGKNINKILTLISPSGNKIDNFTYATLYNGETVVFSHHSKIISKSNKEIYASIICSPIHDMKNKINGAIIVLHDMTEQKKLEDEVIKISKLESMNLLASAIAHDFNNFLTGIVGNIALAKSLVTNESEIFKTLSNTETIAFQAKELASQLLSFSRENKMNKKIVNINNILQDTVLFMTRGTNITCEFDINNNLPPVYVDISQINQVITNLTINSIQAMPNGGKIIIKAEDICITKPTLTIKSGEYIKITFTDTGCGIAPENLNKIFDPYFTTKPRGTGLGLASVYSIIKNHNGFITVDSKLNAGTTFTIYLPVTKSDNIIISNNNEISLSNKQHNCKTYKILFMDDDEIIRKVTSQLLKQYGFEVITASCGSEAIKIYKDEFSKNQTFDLIITDLTVPNDIGGIEMLQEIIKFDKNVKAIASTGYFYSQEEIEHYKLLGFKDFITKPFKIADLIKIIKEVIENQN